MDEDDEEEGGEEKDKLLNKQTKSIGTFGRLKDVLFFGAKDANDHKLERSIRISLTVHVFLLVGVFTLIINIPFTVIIWSNPKTLELFVVHYTLTLVMLVLCEAVIFCMTMFSSILVGMIIYSCWTLKYYNRLK